MLDIEKNYDYVETLFNTNDCEKIIGKTIVSCEVYRNDREATFYFSDGTALYMYNNDLSDVYIEDICGDLDDLLSAPLTEAEIVTNSDIPSKNNEESYTWTFYKFGTKNGFVTIRWYGSSNGYYSETAHCEIYKKIVED